MFAPTPKLARAFAAFVRPKLRFHQKGGGLQLKPSSKKILEKRGIAVAGRAQSAPGASVHADKRRPKRSASKQSVKREIQLETARTRGPFPFLPRAFPANWRT